MRRGGFDDVRMLPFLLERQSALESIQRRIRRGCGGRLSPGHERKIGLARP
jgi:hypothetical protein